MKRFAKWLAIIVIVLGAIAGGFFYSVFAHNKKLVDGQELRPGMRVIKDGFVSVVMIDVGDGKVVLIDAGNDKAGTAIRAELARKKLDDSAVVGIFLTHGHSDHTAAVRTFPKAEIFALATEVARIGDAFTVTHPLSDGDKITIGTLNVEAFATPGHTAGSACYLANGVLFFGDSAGADDNDKVTAAVRLFSSDPAQNIASLKTLYNRLAPRGDDVKVLAFAHTGPLDGLAPLGAFATTH